MFYDIHIGLVTLQMCELMATSGFLGAFPGADVYYGTLPASIVTHIGPGAVGIGMSVDYKEA